MTKKSIFIFSLLTFTSLSCFGFGTFQNKDAFIVKAISSSPTYQSKLPTEINLNHTENDDIRNYYSSLNSLSDTERSGSNLLKNLSPILQDMTYYSYDNIWKIYEITDREWELSPADETTYGTFNQTTNTISDYEYGSNSNPKNDPYVKTLYRNKDENGVTLSDARIKEWGSHAIDGTNREHIWCQSRGFKADKGAEGPAGVDLHHLRSGDAFVNQQLHNDNPYGYVDKSQPYENAGDEDTWLSGNLKGKPKNTSSDDTGDVVFEPQDSDKGDIARAIFYMAACYNNLDGNSEITDFNPNLTIVDYIYDAKSAIGSDENHPASMAKLGDLLEWHKLDPVDEFEIYRNDLIFHNYQGNRNPFIDFPDWVDVVWGNNGKVASPLTDSIHDSAISISKSNIQIDINKVTEFTLTAVTLDSSPISWSVSDSSVLSMNKTTTDSGEEVTFTILKEGDVTITAKATVEGNEVDTTCKVSVFKGFVIQPWMYVVAIIAAVLLLIILLVSSKARKKVKKAAKKAAKRRRKR